MNIETCKEISKRTIGDFLTRKREMSGLTQKEVADIFGYKSPQLISNWERGVSRPSVKAFVKLANIYYINPTSIEGIVGLYLEGVAKRKRLQLKEAFMKEEEA
jgi:transcriptional regulator with XRE-family HTH domain